MTGPAEGGDRGAPADEAPTAVLDHRVVAATREQGAAWCEQVFSAAPAPGGPALAARFSTPRGMVALSSG